MKSAMWFPTWDLTAEISTDWTILESLNRTLPLYMFVTNVGQLQDTRVSLTKIVVIEILKEPWFQKSTLFVKNFTNFSRNIYPHNKVFGKFNNV